MYTFPTSVRPKRTLDMTLIEIDGRTGEGGGQLVRNAVALAAVISQPIRITNVRGNRGKRSGPRGGGQLPSNGKYLIKSCMDGN